MMAQSFVLALRVNWRVATGIPHFSRPDIMGGKDIKVLVIIARRGIIVLLFAAAAAAVDRYLIYV